MFWLWWLWWGGDGGGGGYRIPQTRLLVISILLSIDDVQNSVIILNALGYSYVYVAIKHFVLSRWFKNLSGYIINICERDFR